MVKISICTGACFAAFLMVACVEAHTPQMKAVFNDNDQVEIAGSKEHVVRLTAADFEYSLRKESSAFVKFVAPWCGHCKRLEPEFVNAAKYFANVRQMIGFFTVDATKEKKLSKKYGVDGFPTILYVENITAGKYSVYEGPRTAKGIKEYLKKKNPALAQANLKHLKTEEEFSKFLSFKDAVFVGAFSSTDSDEFKAFSKASAFEEIPYAYTLDQNVAKAASIDQLPGMNILISTGEINKYSGSLTDENSIDAFAIHRQFGSMIRYSARAHKKIFDSQFDAQLVLFLKDKNPDQKEDFLARIKLNEKLQEMFVNASKAYGQTHGHGTSQPRWVLVRVNQFLLPEDYPYVYKLGHSCNIRKENDFPKLCFFKRSIQGDGAAAKAGLTKYAKDASKIESEDSFANFIEEVGNGNVEELKQSETPVDDSTKTIKTLVGENFETNVFGKWRNENVLVMIYADWCKASQSVLPEYDRLAQKLYPQTRNLILAKFDAASNEASSKASKSEKYPRFRLFKGSREDKEQYVEFKGEKSVKPTVQILTDFIKEHILLMDTEGFQKKVDL